MPENELKYLDEFYNDRIYYRKCGLATVAQTDYCPR